MYQISYNGTTLDPNYYIITKLDLTDIPVRISEQNITSRHGGVIWKRLYSPRTITIEGALVATDATTYMTQWRALISLFNANSDSAYQLAITADDGTTRYINAKVVQVPDIVETEGERFMGIFQIILRGEDPFFTDLPVTTVMTTSSTAGFPVPSPVKTPLGGIPATTLNVVMSGDIGCYPICTINPQITNPRLTNTTTGDTWALNTTITSPTLVYFDNAGLHVGTDNALMQYFSGTFFRLAQGNNNLVFSGSNITGATLNITTNNCYVSI